MQRLIFGTCSRRKLRRCDIYTSDDALEQATAPLYNRAWFDLNSRAIVPLGSNRANDNFSRWGAPEFTNFKVTALSENLANAWTGFYSVITMANAVISDVQTKCSNSVANVPSAQPLPKPA